MLEVEALVPAFQGDLICQASRLKNLRRFWENTHTHTHAAAHKHKAASGIRGASAARGLQPAARPIGLLNWKECLLQFLRMQHGSEGGGACGAEGWTCALCVSLSLSVSVSLSHSGCFSEIPATPPAEANLGRVCRLRPPLPITGSTGWEWEICRCLAKEDFRERERENQSLWPLTSDKPSRDTKHAPTAQWRGLRRMKRMKMRMRAVSAETFPPSTLPPENSFRTA